MSQKGNPLKICAHNTILPHFRQETANRPHLFVALFLCFATGCAVVSSGDEEKSEDEDTNVFFETDPSSDTIGDTDLDTDTENSTETHTESDTTADDTDTAKDAGSGEDTDTTAEDTDTGSGEDTDTTAEDTDTGSGEDTETDTDTLEAACSDGVSDQMFGDNMVGCAGTVTWPNRDTLCASGWVSCSALKWIKRRKDIAPTHNYWTSDDLGYQGPSEECSVSTNAAYSCPENNPMRVCAALTDPEGNRCNWINCGYIESSPNEYFGGCIGNETAGTVCCR